MTAIEWTDETWNPVTGCTKVSPGCVNCYAERVTQRFGRQRFGDVVLHPDRLEIPLHWRRPRRVFVNSMGDLFHEDVPFDFIAEVFHVMTGECDYKPSPDHTYQILTKRPKQMLSFFSWLADYPESGEPFIYALQTLWYFDNPSKRVWLGVSCEDQPRLEERVISLLETPAAIHFISLEPLIAPVTLRTWLQASYGTGGGSNRIDWVIVGGESGPKARPMKIEWLESIVKQCRNAGVPVFVKQDSGPRPGQWGRIPKELRIREYPR